MINEEVRFYRWLFQNPGFCIPTRLHPCSHLLLRLTQELLVILNEVKVNYRHVCIKTNVFFPISSVNQTS